MQNQTDVQWKHSHNFGIDNQQNVTKVKIVFWLTSLIMLLEITVGSLSGSMALLADGWHMGTHSAAFLLTLFAYAYAKKHANNQQFSFGTGKVNYLGGFASAVALAIIALIMALESIQRLIEPQNIHFNQAIGVAVIGFIVNVASVFILHDEHHHGHEHSQGHQHEHDHDHNLKAAYFHVLADTLTSLLAIAALLTGKYLGWIWMDALMGIVGSVVIGKWSYGLIKESSHVLLVKSVGQPYYSQIAAAIKSQYQADVNDIHIWKIGRSHHAAILSVSTPQPQNPAIYKPILQTHLPHLSHISIEVNPQQP
ncbi:CDF family Co(II)/Ni(II) efflux transporter DmeF [Neptunicella sp. SCSIO 80796]|uniref:CDF family Co(II)/Ni(II) efflux transporter DmeF n=1 Tax=Neptunicella plasticusilytica TaxID=3117012 RepID=UPI003A4DAF1B